MRLDHRADARLAHRRAAHHAAYPWLVRLGNAYVELFRNIPLLVQMFLWYFVLPELRAAGDRHLAQAAAQRLVLHRRGLPRLLHLGARRRAGARRHLSLPRGQRMAGARARPHAAADLPLRAAADGLSHHPAAADLGIPQHHQEQRGRADHRPDGADRRARARCRNSPSRCSRRSPPRP